MVFRHEWKHEISRSDMLCLRGRLKNVMCPDVNAIDSKYSIRSLYFDDLFDTALREKIDGINVREKFRLRYYNGDSSFILLEKKSKINGLCQKKQIQITVEEANALINRNYENINIDGKLLLGELVFKMQSAGLRAKTIVDYEREPFVYSPGNVRVTIDYNIRTGLTCTDFLNSNCATVPVPGSPIILEVKWDEFLPNIIRDIVQLRGRRTSAFSKYASCRLYD